MVDEPSNILRPAPPTVLEPLSPEHDFSTFDCGTTKIACHEINTFLREGAVTAQANRENETYILRYSGEQRVRAYITVAPGSMSPKQLKPTEGWDIPLTCSHIAYVGADLSVQGGGWGAHLIDWAIQRACAQQGIRAVHLYAYPDMIDYYIDNFGFFKHGKPEEDTPAARQLMIYDILTATLPPVEPAVAALPVPLARKPLK